MGSERVVRMWVMSGGEIRPSASWSRREKVEWREGRRGAGMGRCWCRGKEVVVEWMAVMALVVRVGEGGVGRVVRGGGRPRGVVQGKSLVGVDGFGAVVDVVSSLEGEVCGIVGVERDLVGVEGRIVEGESVWRRGEAGESGRRKGEVRGEPKERGEGL